MLHFFKNIYLKESKCRRLDLVTVPEDEWVFAVLGWTGSAVFERSLRLRAEKMGYHLSSHALEAIQHGRNEMVRVDNEQQIFDILGLAYIPPNLRNC